MSDITGLIMHQGDQGTSSDIATRVACLLQTGAMEILSSEGFTSAQDCARILQLRVESSHSVGKEILGASYTISRLSRFEPEHAIRVVHLRSPENLISAYSTGHLEDSFSYTMVKRTGVRSAAENQPSA